MKWTVIYLYLFLSALIIAAANVVFGSENEIEIVTLVLSSFAMAFILTDFLQKKKIKTPSLQSSQEEAIEDPYYQMIDQIEEYAVIRLDPDGNIKSWNKGAELLHKYSMEEILGKNASVFHSAEDREAEVFSKILKDALKNGEASKECWRVRKSGDEFWSRVVVNILRDKNKNHVGFILVAYDYTEEKKRDDRIRFLASLASNIQDPIISSDNNYLINDWNDAAERLFGWTRDEVIGKHVDKLLNIDFGTTSREDSITSYVEKGYWQGEVIYHTKTGQPLNVIASASMIKTDDGKVIGNLVLVKDITPIKKSEAELLRLNTELEALVEERTKEVYQNEQRFKFLIENNDSIIAIVDKESKTIYRSPSAERLTGWTFEDVEDTSAFERIHPDDREKALKVYSFAMANPGAPFKIALRVKHKDGRYLWLDGIVTNLFNEPNVGGMLTNFKDISDIKEVEEELEKNEKRFRTLVDKAEDIISLVDEKGKVIYVSPAFERATGFPVDYMIGRINTEIMHPDQVEESKLVFQELLNNPGKVLHRINRFRHVDGHYVWVEGQVVNLLNNENVKAIVANYRDISEKKQSQDTAIEMNERFSIVSKATHDVVWDWNLVTNDIWWNDNFYELFGLKNEVPQTIETWTQGLHEADRDRVVSKLEKVTQSGEKFWSDEYRYNGAGGKIFYILDRGSIIRDSEGKPIRMIGSMINISDQKIAEEKEKKYVAELERSNKELEQFAYIASHDLQEPLRMVGSYVQLLEQRYKGRLDSDADEFISFAVDGATRMKQLINDLLNYSKLNKTMPVSQVNIGSVINEVLVNLKSNIEDKNAIVTIDEMPTIAADKTQMTQVFQNLIANAIKFQSSGNTPKIRISSVKKENEWLFSVEDNGIGIDKQYHDKVFIIFRQLHSKAKFSGTGIGLAIVKKIVDRHGGSIWFESEPGKGTIFYFTIKNKNE